MSSTFDLRPFAIENELFYGSPAADPALGSSKPAFSDTLISQSKSKADVTISANSSETNNTKKNCNSEHSSKRRKTSEVWKYYTRLVIEHDGNSVKYKSCLRCAGVYKESTGCA